MKPRDELGVFVEKDIYNQLQVAAKAVKEADQDRVFIVDGMEGSGKSTLGMQLAYCVDHSLSLDNIVYSSKEFETKIRNLSQHSAVIFDEAFVGLSSRNALSKENKYLISALQQCRQNNLFIFLILPSYFLLEKYPAIFRSKALFHTQNDPRNVKQKYYKVYNYEMKKQLYLLGKPLMDYRRPFIRRKYRFTPRLPPTISEEEYRKKKRDALQANYAQEEGEESKWKRRTKVLLHFVLSESEKGAVPLAKTLRERYDLDLKWRNIYKLVENVEEKTPNTTKDPYIPVNTPIYR